MLIQTDVAYLTQTLNKHINGRWLLTNTSPWTWNLWLLSWVCVLRDNVFAESELTLTIASKHYETWRNDRIYSKSFLMQCVCMCTHTVICDPSLASAVCLVVRHRFMSSTSFRVASVTPKRRYINNLYDYKWPKYTHNQNETMHLQIYTWITMMSRGCNCDSNHQQFYGWCSISSG